MTAHDEKAEKAWIEKWRAQVPPGGDQQKDASGRSERECKDYCACQENRYVHTCGCHNETLVIPAQKDAARPSPEAVGKNYVPDHSIVKEQKDAARRYSADAPSPLKRWTLHRRDCRKEGGYGELRRDFSPWIECYDPAAPHEPECGPNDETHVTLVPLAALQASEQKREAAVAELRRAAGDALAMLKEDIESGARAILEAVGTAPIESRVDALVDLTMQVDFWRQESELGHREYDNLKRERDDLCAKLAAAERRAEEAEKESTASASHKDTPASECKP